MAKQLNIPYRSQRDSDALYAPSDCGAACVAMILEAVGVNVSIDDVFKNTHQHQTKFLSRSDLKHTASHYSLALEKFQDGNKDFIVSSINQNRPLIALVNYQAWVKPGSGVETQSKFEKTHFVVVTGYDGNDILINDPLWWGIHRAKGKNKRMTYAQFAAAWGTCHEYFNNPDFVGLIASNPIPGTAVPTDPAVTQAEVNRIMAWGAFNGIPIDESVLVSRPVADVYLSFMGNWGTTNVVTHRVANGEDLGIIALRYYNDPMKWKVIAYFNDLPPIDAFQPGDTLRIPEPINTGINSSPDIQ